MLYMSVIYHTDNLGATEPVASNTKLIPINSENFMYIINLKGKSVKNYKQYNNFLYLREFSIVKIKTIYRFRRMYMI